MPPRRLMSSTKASTPYCGPTKAPGSNALLRLLIVPRVMVVGVTPTSEALLRGAPGRSTPAPGGTFASPGPATPDPVGLAEATTASGAASPAAPGEAPRTGAAVS